MHPELQPSVADQDRMDQGTAVGELATKRFPGGVLIDLPYHQMRGKVEATREALAAGAPAIFEASFWEDEVFVAVDILERRGNAFRLIEVKATTRVKEEHIPDAAVQLHVLRKAGLDVQEVALMHLNKEYRHPGPEPLFSLSDITPEAEAMLPEIPGLIQSSHDVLAGPDPGPCIGNQWGRPWECALDESCWPEDPDHIRHLYGIGPKKALELMADGIHTFDDLPPNAKVNEKALRQLEVWRTGTMRVEPTLKQDLAPFQGRIGFLDFETIMRAVPLWDGLAPYGLVPVQFSYHERQADGSYTHQEWLAEGPEDPRPDIARALVEVTQHAHRVATYTGYEKRCIDALKDAVPELGPELDDLISRLVDLKKVVEKNLAHPDFHGSYSIKDVLTPHGPRPDLRRIGGRRWNDGQRQAGSADAGGRLIDAGPAGGRTARPPGVLQVGHGGHGSAAGEAGGAGVERHGIAREPAPGFQEADESTTSLGNDHDATRFD